MHGPGALCPTQEDARLGAVGRSTHSQLTVNSQSTRQSTHSQLNSQLNGPRDRQILELYKGLVEKGVVIWLDKGEGWEDRPLLIILIKFKSFFGCPGGRCFPVCVIELQDSVVPLTVELTVS